MLVPTLEESCNTWWDSVCSRIKDAVVFIDQGASECLHWNGGLMKLIENGAVNVKEFSSFESAADISKAVFILTTPLWRLTLDILHDIFGNSKITHCVIVSSAEARVHILTKYGNLDSVPVGDQGTLTNLREQLLRWMGNINYFAEIVYVPLFTISICPGLFLTPPFSDLFPLLSCNINVLQNLSVHRIKSDRKPVKSLSEMDFAALPQELQVSITQFVSNFNSLLEMLDARDDCYSMGYFSRIVGTELEQLPAARARRKVASNKVSLLFIDRTLDMAQAASYNFETLLDKILYLLPKITNHSMDVAVDISPLCVANNNSLAKKPVLVCGSLSHSKDSASTDLLHAFVTKKQKECIMEIHRQLGRAASKQYQFLGDAGKLSRVSVETLLSHVSKFKNDPLAIANYLGILQQSLATIQALQHPDNNKLDVLLGIEKALMQMLIEADNINCKLRIAQLVRERKTRCLTLEEILILLLRLYTLKGKDFLNSEDERNDMLKAVLGDAMLQDYSDLPNYLKTLIGSEVDESTVHSMITKVFDVLDSVGTSREGLMKYNSILNSGNSAQPASYEPLLKQVFDDIFHPLKPDLIDLECRSSGLKDRLKSSLGLFLNVNKPRPSDHQIMMVFIIGGITSSEIRQIRELLHTYRPTLEVIIGSTRLALPKNTLQLLLENKLCNS